METRIVRYREKTRILGAILLLCSLVFFFVAFMGTSFVAIGWHGYTALTGLVEGGPVELFIDSFSVYGLEPPAGVIIGFIIFYILFLGTLTLTILTGVYALVNKKFFTPIPVVCVAGTHALIFIVQAKGSVNASVFSRLSRISGSAM